MDEEVKKAKGERRKLEGKTPTRFWRRYFSGKKNNNSFSLIYLFILALSVILNPFLAAKTLADTTTPNPTTVTAAAASFCKADETLPRSNGSYLYASGILTKFYFDNNGSVVKITVKRTDASPEINRTFSNPKNVGAYGLLYTNTVTETASDVGGSFQPLLYVDLKAYKSYFVKDATTTNLFYLNKASADITDYEILINSVYETKLNCNAFSVDITGASFVPPTTTTAPKIKIPADVANGRPSTLTFTLGHIIAKRGAWTINDNVFYFLYDKTQLNPSAWEKWAIRIHVSGDAYGVNMGSDINSYQDDSDNTQSSLINGTAKQYATIKIGTDNKQQILDNLINWVYNDSGAGTSSTGVVAADTTTDTLYPTNCGKYTGPTALKNATWTSNNMPVDGCINFNGLSGASIDTRYAAEQPDGWIKKWGNITINQASVTNPAGTSVNECSSINVSFNILSLSSGIGTAIKSALCNVILTLFNFGQSLFKTAKGWFEQSVGLQITNTTKSIDTTLPK